MFVGKVGHLRLLFSGRFRGKFSSELLLRNVEITTLAKGSKSYSNMKVEGKTALITGGASGLGKAFAEELLKKGAKSIAIVDVNSELGQATTTELGSTYGDEKVKFFKCDVTNEDEVQDTFDKCHAEFKTLNIVCNSAGVNQLPEWKKTLDINLYGVISCTLKAKELMLQQTDSEAVIVNIASAAGLLPSRMMPVYVASKHGVVGFSKSVAFGLDAVAKKLRVNTLCPSYVDTPLFHNGKANADPRFRAILEALNLIPIEEVVDAFMRLIEDDSNTGTVLLITPGKGIEKHEYLTPDECVKEYKFLKV